MASAYLLILTPKHRFVDYFYKTNTMTMRALLFLLIPALAFSQDLKLDEPLVAYNSQLFKLKKNDSLRFERSLPPLFSTEMVQKDYSNTLQISPSLLTTLATEPLPNQYSRSFQFNLGGRDYNPQRDAFNNNAALREAVGNTPMEFGFDTGATFCPGGQ